MNIFTLGAIISILTLALGGLLAFLLVSLGNAVTANEARIDEDEKNKQQINPKATGGFAFSPTDTLEEKVLDARKIAAKAAAAMPRGANFGIGRLGTTDARKNKKHASKGVDEDPVTAVKIAEYHTWNGLEITKDAVAAPVKKATGTGVKVKRKLVPGTDYAFTDITGLTGGEKRTAIIANAKAKSAAYKAMKASGTDMVEEVVETTAPAAVSDAPSATPSANLPPEPVMIEITDDMSPDEKRSAKIANSKAKSAYKKQLKAMGIDPNAPVPAAAPAPVAEAAAAPAVETASSAPAPTGELPPAPDMVEITDDMSPDDKRAAKIANSKAKSAYKKQLKAMGIDPKTVDI